MFSRQRVLVLAFLTVVIIAVAVGMVWAEGEEPDSFTDPQHLRVEASLSGFFSFQGRLLDNGRPANGRYDFRFKLYDAATGGNRIGNVVTYNDVMVRDGLFRVSLNFGSGVFYGQAGWVQVEVRPGNSSGSYTLLTPRYPILPVPYAMSLQPGAFITGNMESYILTLINGGDGPGLYVRSGHNGVPDLVLGANSPINDDGVLSSYPPDEDSDIVIKTNDTLRIDLDADGSGDDADFEIRDKDGVLLFDVDESGTIQSSALTHVFVPGGEAVPHADSPDLEFKYYGRGTVAVRKTSSGSGERWVVFPVSLPSVLYGQPVRITHLRVYYRTTNSASYITETDLYRERLDGNFYTLIQNTSNHKATTFTRYTIGCTVSQCRLSENEGFVSVVLRIYFKNNVDRLILGGVRITLAHK